MTLYDKIASVSAKAGQSAWATRIVAELNFAAELSTVRDHSYDALIETVADKLRAAAEQEGGVITKAAAMEAEEALMPLEEIAVTEKPKFWQWKK